jgi:tRNA1(Val) A37 N6-methylase TrmN6
MSNQIDFPWRSYSSDELITEYILLKKKVDQDIIFPLPFSTIGYKCTNQFFQYERMNTPGLCRPSTIEYWNNNRDKVIKFAAKMGQKWFVVLNYFNHSPSHFPIVTAAKIYRYFEATKVFDPYAGWGDRCLAAMSVDIDYTGIDKNANLQCPFSHLKQYPTKSKVNIIIDACENIDVSSIDFDFVLSSPPFWKRTKMMERYNDIEVTYQEFLSNSLIPTMTKCLNKNVWFCLYIPEDMYNDLTKTFGNCAKILKCKFNNRNIENVYCWNVGI